LLQISERKRERKARQLTVSEIWRGRARGRAGLNLEIWRERVREGLKPEKVKEIKKPVDLEHFTLSLLF